METIHDLVRLGDLSRLESLLQVAADPRAAVNEVDALGVSPLLYALQAPVDTAIVRRLLEAGAAIGAFHLANDGKNAVTKEMEMPLIAAGFDFVLMRVRGVATFGELALVLALRSGDREIVRMFADRGADFSYVGSGNHSALLDAVYSDFDPTAVVEFLIQSGAPLDVRSKYGESAASSALHRGWFDAVRQLLAAGADETEMAWTPLIRAAAIGTADDVRRELTQDPDVEAQDSSGRTALHMALWLGDAAMVEALLTAGVQIAPEAKQHYPYLSMAVQSGNPAVVERMLKAGCPINAGGLGGDSAISLAAENGDSEIVRLLLAHGADPESGSEFDKPLSNAKTRETILMLLEAGANPAGLDAAGRRRLVGLGNGGAAQLSSISREQYLAARYEREGSANPEDITEPFRLAMIRSGLDAYGARRRFDDDPVFACGISKEKRPPQVWCFDRFGQSFTILPDGRTILIAGEHEDAYDPDFCIYNDVTMFSPDGSIQIFGYPRDVFEPTDFHTATLVGDHIWIIGGVGYLGQRNTAIPVYRLDTRTFAIERIETTGDVPPRLHGHRATLIDNGIEIRGGKSITFPGGKERNDKNPHTYRLDLESLAWKRLKR